MFRLQKKIIAPLALALTLMMGVMMTPAPTTNAADHGDGPTANLDKSADIGDVYAFLDPNDNSRLILIGTLQGFINPGEAINFGAFDQNLRFRFDIETTGDAREDQFFDIRFTARTMAANQVQTATVICPFGEIFTAPTTPASFADTPPAPTITTDPVTGISFFAGPRDDPFFFDIPGFGRFVSSVLGGAPNPAALTRGRDSFAGFNNLCIALSVPVSYLRLRTNEIGVAFRTQRRLNQMVNKDGTVSGFGRFTNVDRMGNPAVNVALTPFPIKDQYNAASPLDDSRGRFAPSIIGVLTALGTNATNIGILASVAVVRGDFLRLRTDVANTGTGGGDSAGAGFPNGRRLRDDVIDIELSIITNGAITTGDNVNANDMTFINTFPFLAPSHVPLPPGTTDDRTRH
ncbi:MAG: DUF4331 family protein [Acidobacteriota bacterium]